MKANQRQRLKAHAPRPLFSCGFFRHCTQSVLSPTAPHPPSLPDPTATSHPPPPPPAGFSPPPPPTSSPAPPPPQKPLTRKPESSSSSSSSSTSTSQSFTHWRFPLPSSPHHHHGGYDPRRESEPRPVFTPPSNLTPSPLIPSASLQELFHIAELRLSSESDSDQLAALQLLERSIVPNPPLDPTCPPELMRALVACLKSTRPAAKPVTKVLLALCLAQGNRRVAVEAGAAGAVVETVGEMEDSSAERALAALELMCTVPEGAAEVQAHALSVPVMVAVMARLAGRGREYAISVLAVIYGADSGGDGSCEGMPTAPPEEVARAVMLALQGECTARGTRKGAQLLQTLKEYGRLDLTQDGK